MEETPYTFPSDNTSFSLCPTTATLFFLPSAYTVFFLTSLLGNMLSLWVFFRYISTISPIHIYLSHLNISNLLMCLSAPFLTAYYAQGSVWTLNGFLCQLVLHGVTPVLHINIYISVAILTGVALTRFATLIQHTHASRPSACTKLLPHSFFICLTRTSFARRLCATLWVVGVGGVVPVTVYYSLTEAAAGGGGDKAEKEGCVEVCYNPAVELGGSLSAAFNVPVIAMFFMFYLLVLLSYITVLRHIGRSRRNTNITASQNLLGRVLRNILVIQVVLSVCLLPYHIFKAIFITLAHDQRHLTYSPGPKHCHPLSGLVELKNCLLFLAALRGSADPLMYFLLDKTFRQHTLRFLRCNRTDSSTKMCQLDTASANQRAGQLDGGNVSTAAVDFSQ